MNSNILLDDFFTFLRFQSISTDPAYRSEIIKCVNWLKEYLEKMNFEVELWETKDHPTLFAKNLKAGPDQPTLLIYNHYDVQPVDPLELWDSPPFEPQLRKGEVYARGAQDNKGQCFYVLLALRRLLEENSTLHINIKLCIEGGEEIGSEGLSGILSQKKRELQADHLAILDLGIPSSNTPAITLGLRGLVTFEVEIHGPSMDLHSGTHGGLAPNPIQALVTLLASLHDDSGKIAVPGFYDDVAEIHTGELSKLNLEFDSKKYQTMFGVPPKGGESQYSAMERAWLRPTLEINGITGGYTQEGFKTVIPAKASAKISCRLVPDQDPKKILKLLSDHLKKNAPQGLQVKVSTHSAGGKAIRTNPSSPIIQAFAQAYTEVFQKPCQYILEGASVPVVPALAAVSSNSVAMVGLGLPDDHIHAPNEHFGIDRIDKGAQIIARTIKHLSLSHHRAH